MSRLTTTPPDESTGIARRTVKRATIAELNATDIDTIRERLAQSRRDDRGPVEKFLDLLDYPRNQIMAMAAPGLEREARARGDIGASGTGKVFGSDVLKSLGIENRVARGVLGFATDVAFDPLTYIGPAGWGFKSARATGQGVRIGLRGKRAIKDAIKATKAGTQVVDPEVRRLVEVASKSAPAGGDLASHVSQRILGPVTSGRVARGFARVGGETTHTGGILSRFDEFGLKGLDADEADAARAFVAKYGKGSAPGIRIGRDAGGKLRVAVGGHRPGGPVATSTIAHIPFTEFGIHVPAFTADGKAAADALRIATSAGRMNPVVAAGRSVSDAERVVRDIEAFTDYYNAGDPAAEQYLEGLRARLRDTANIASPAEPENLGELLALRRLIKEGEAAADRAKAHASMGTVAEDAFNLLAEANQKYADAVRGSIKQFASAETEGVQRVAMRALGIDDDVIGASLFTPVKTAAKGIGDPGVTADIANRIDRAGRGVFGQPGGALRSMVRYVRNSMTTGAREAFHHAEREMRTDIVRALAESGISNVSPDDYSRAAQVAFAHMYRLRNAQADELGQAPVFYTTKHGSTEKAEWVQLLDEAQKAGYFAETPNGRLVDKLSAIAAKHVHALDEIGSAEYADKVLNRVARGYVPTVTTEPAKQRMASIAKNAVTSRRGSARAIGLESEQFQKPRSMLQYRWQDPETGTTHRFFEKDRWTQTLSDAEIKLIADEDPDAARYAVELRDTINRYDELARDQGFAERYAPRSTDPWELNELQRSGALSLLTGGDEIPGGFADLNIATAMANRYMAHERATARRTWLEYVKQFGVSVNPRAMQGQMVPGNKMRLKDGSEATFFRDKDGTWGFEQMGQRYRGLSESVKGLKNNPMLEAIGDTKALVYHEDVARAIEDMARAYDGDASGILRAMDSVTGAWKTLTLFSPTWTTFNIIGDGLNYIMGGANPADIARNAPNVVKAIYHADNPDALRNIVFNVRGTRITGEQLVADLREHRLLGNNRHAETAMQLIGRRVFTMPSMVRGAEGRGALDDFRPASLKADFVERLGHEAAASRAKNIATATGFVARDRMMRRVIAPWFRLNEKVSDSMRALAYLSFLEQGHDIPSAVQRTIRAGFDYADNTRVERDMFKRMFPFYSWMRLNGAYQMKLLMERPIYAGSFPLLQNAIEESIAGDEQIPQHARPQWMRNQLALMVGSDPEDRMAILLGQALPLEQALVAGGAFMGTEGLQDFARYFLTSLSPVIRSPAEFASGREFYSGRSIGPGGDIEPGAFLTSQIRPIRESGRIAKTVSEQGIGPAATRLFLGGRVQPASDDRLSTSRLREFSDEEQRLRLAIRRADRNGDTAARAVAGARILQLYEAMILGGFESEVPKWAQKALQSTAPAPM